MAGAEPSSLLVVTPIRRVRRPRLARIGATGYGTIYLKPVPEALDDGDIDLVAVVVTD